MILWFENIGVLDAAKVGGKAANLGECARAGLPVPRGFVVGTEAYRQATRSLTAEIASLAERGEAESARDLILTGALPETISNAITSAYRKLGEPPVAVRSSATAEDLADASFAGQQDTYLNVCGIDELLTAVRCCWASLWSDRAVAYRTQQGVKTDGLALAVVVQEMVAPDVAGVLFTRNPVSGDDKKMLVSASYGLGESVVSALVTPDTYELARATGTLTQREIGTKETRIDAASSGTVTGEVLRADRERPCLSDAQLLQLLTLGKRVEKHYGSGQDIEWAFVGDELYLLQARPITTEVADVPGHEPVRGRFGEFLRDDLTEHFPGPFPLDLVAVRGVIDGALRAFGVSEVQGSTLIQGDDDGVIRLTLARFKPLGSFVRNLPRTLREAFRHDPFVWADEERAWRRELGVMEESAKGLRSANDAAVFQLMVAALEQAEAITHDRFLNYLVPMMTRRNNATVLIKLARLSKAITTEDLYAGVPYKTAEITAALTELADKARHLGVADAITSAPQGEVAAALQRSSEGQEFLEAAESFLFHFGARTARLYLPFSNRSWREAPETFYALLAASLRGDRRAPDSGADPASQVEQRLPRLLRKFWRRNTEQIRAMHIGREGTVYLIEEFLCVARAARDEIARRLVERGQLTDVEDLKFLYVEEVEEALRGSGDAGTARQQDITQQPVSDEDPGTPRGERLKALVVRRRRRRALAELVWWDHSGSGSSQQFDADVSTQLTGLSASAGLAHGPACIVRSPSDFHLLRPGDVLVCPYTDPTWTPLFSLATAVVAETGGPLSHAAIVAREYGIPAVLGANGATNLRAGAELAVDGSKGTVSVRPM